MRKRKCNRTEAGLTLIEVMVGLAITSIVFVILLAALRAGYSSGEKGRERQDVSRHMRILTDRLSLLLRGAYPYVIEKPGGKILFFKGSSSQVGFVTTAVDAFSEDAADRAGLKWVSVFADDEGLKMREKMYFGEDVFEDFGGKEFVFDRRVREIRFSYLDRGEKENLDVWTSVWEPLQKAYLPAAVKAELTIESDGKKIPLPPVIAAIRGGHKIK